jgi:MFS family permease
MKNSLQSVEIKQTSRSKWYILILAGLTFAFVVAMPMRCMPVLFKEISGELGLDLVQIGTVWGMLSLGSVFIIPIGGLISDRFGVKSTIVLVCFLTGLTGALRGLSNDFLSLMATSFTWGLISSIAMPVLNIIASLSVSKRQQGLAQGLLGAGGGIGFILGALISATFLSPWLGGWRNVLFLYGGIAIVMSLLWLFTMKEPSRQKSVDSKVAIPLRQAFTRLLRLKAIWLLGIALLAYYGCIQGMSGFLPIFLRNNGWQAAAADGTLATYSVVSAIVVIPLAMLSDKIGSRKLCLFGGFAAGMLGIGLLSVIHNEFVWLLVIIAGFFGIAPPLLTTLCIETKEVGTAFSGTAVSLVIAIAHIGGSIAPPIGNSLASINNGLPFVFWAGLAVCGIIALSFVKETGWRISNVR